MLRRNGASVPGPAALDIQMCIRDRAFTNADGSKSTVHMRNLRDERFNYAENEYFAMAELPYGNEAFSMVVLLPAEGKSLDECLPQLNDEDRPGTAVL